MIYPTSFILRSMRRLLLALLLTATLQAQPLELNLRAEAAILINLKTGKVLFEKDAHQPIFPASTTKIATALYVLHKYGNELDKVFVADREAIASISPQAKRQSNYRSPAYWLETDGTHAGIKRGEEFSLSELLHVMLIASANDAANVIAHGISGSIPKFMEELNGYLKKIGCQETFFINPHGLHHPSHVTSAFDLALMAREAMKNPIFRQIVSMLRYTCPQTNLEMERHLIQTNQLLKKGSPFYYPKANGIKTGTTQNAGKNIVASAVDGNRELIAVAMGYKAARSELYEDVINMFDAAFKEPKMRRTILSPGVQKITKRVKGAKKPLVTFLEESLAYEFYPSEETSVRLIISWEDPLLPIAFKTPVAKLKLIDDQANCIAEASLLAYEEVQPAFFYTCTHALFFKRSLKQWLFICAAFCICTIVWRFKRKKQKLRSLL